MESDRQIHIMKANKTKAYSKMTARWAKQEKLLCLTILKTFRFQV